MVLQDVSPALQERLGHDGTVGLLSLLAAARQEWSAEVTHHTVERFQRRLTEEAAGLKTVIGSSESAVRLETAQVRSELRQGLSDVRGELKQGLSELRVEFKQELSELRVEFKQELSDLRVEFKQELSDLRVELKGDISRLDASVNESLLKQTRWMFGMWVGQIAATAAIVAGMFRVFAP